MALGLLALTILLGSAMLDPSEPGGGFPPPAWFVLAILVASIPICWSALLSWTIALATKRVALRVDEAGVALGRGTSLLAPIGTVPWADLQRIVLFEFPMGDLGYRPFIGLQLRPGSVLPRGVPSKARLDRRPADVSRHVCGWDLDVKQLYEAVQVHGPHVPVVNLGRHSDGWRAMAAATMRAIRPQSARSSARRGRRRPTGSV
jgi:hypothetical protein